MTTPKRHLSDPFAAWREWLSESERQWNAYLNQAMASDEFSRHMGQFMEVYVNMQKSMNEAMGRYFSALNIATRTDVISLGERLGAIEDKIDALSRQVAAQSRGSAPTAGGKATAAATPRPRRTKQPPKSETSQS